MQKLSGTSPTGTPASPGSTPALLRSLPQETSTPHTAGSRHGTSKTRPTRRPSSAMTPTAKCTASTSAAPGSSSPRTRTRRSGRRSRPGPTPRRPSREVGAMDNEIILVGAFLGTGLLAYVIVPGLLVMWDRVLDHMEAGEEKK